MKSAIRLMLILVGAGLLAAAAVGSTMFSAVSISTRPWAPVAAPPDDTSERWGALESARHELESQARTAGMARFEAESLRRRAAYAAAESRRATEVDARIRDTAAQLAEVRRATEEQLRQVADQGIADGVDRYVLDLDAAEIEKAFAVAFKASDDAGNVAQARSMVRVSYGADPAREAGWARSGAWSAAARDARERTAMVRTVANREARETAFKADVTKRVQTKLNARIAELRRRNVNVLAGMRRDAAQEAQRRAEQFARAEDALRAVGSSFKCDTPKSGNPREFSRTATSSRDLPANVASGG